MTDPAEFLPSGVVTFVLTDIEGSTALWEANSGGMSEALARHDRLVSDVIADYGGRCIKSKGEGDSSLSVFERASDALRAAGELLRAFNVVEWPDSIELKVRLGVHTGECEVRDGDYFGTTVNRAARIRGLATGGEALVSEATAQLVADLLPEGTCLLPIGEYELRGLTRPERIFRLRVPAAVEPEGTPAPLPASVIAELARLLDVAGLGDEGLHGRHHSVVLVFPGTGIGRRYPDLSGCGAELSAFAVDAEAFASQGVRLYGLTGEPVVRPEGDPPLPFPVGILPQEEIRRGLDAVERDGRWYATRASYLLFPDGTGMAVTGIGDVTGHARRCLDLVVGRRLESYRAAVLACPIETIRSLPSVARIVGSLPNGADSVSISRVELAVDLVCKMASPPVIEAEARHIEYVNRLLIDAGRRPIFPTVVKVCVDQDPAWYLMEAANPVPLDQIVFADEFRTVLDPGRAPLLFDAISELGALYEVTLRREAPAIARYHYVDRFSVVPARADVRETFLALCGDEVGLEELLRSHVVIDGTFHCRPYNDQLEFLSAHAHELVQPISARLHGDVHLANMLLGADGEHVTFIDPRTVWDDQANDEPGIGDPLYDFGTLLHSVHVMSAVLRANEIGVPDALLAVERDRQGSVQITTGVAPIAENDTAVRLVDWLHEGVSADLLGPNWRARLAVNAANALLGWLKYERAVASREAWYVVFAAMLHHLEQARLQIEGGRT